MTNDQDFKDFFNNERIRKKYQKKLKIYRLKRLAFKICLCMMVFTSIVFYYAEIYDGKDCNPEEIRLKDFRLNLGKNLSKILIIQSCYKKSKTPPQDFSSENNSQQKQKSYIKDIGKINYNQQKSSSEDFKEKLKKNTTYIKVFGGSGL